MEMIELDIAMENELISRTRGLAMRYFGDDSDASLAQLLELAFTMRCLWSSSVRMNQQETGEAISTWEFPESTVKQENSENIQNWLFRR